MSTTTKRCRRCGQIKPASDFHAMPRNRDGLRSWCKPCALEATRQWRARRRAARAAELTARPGSRARAWQRMQRDARRATELLTRYVRDG